MKKLLFILTIIRVPLFLAGQSTIIKHYDAEWNPSDSAKSTYRTEFKLAGDGYSCLCYWKGTQKIAGKGTFKDTSITKPIGLFIGYHKNGNTEDSSFYDQNSTLQYAYRYYKNKQLEVHYTLPENKTEPVIEAFDEEGKRIKGYIYAKEAEFKGGDKAWQSYILKSVSKDLKAKNKADKRVSVKIIFCISEDGYTTKIKILESSGISYVDSDAMRVIANSPQWKNAIYLNKPIKVYRIQPFTYELADPK